MLRKGFFITGTDSGVGKTMMTAAVAAILKWKGNSVGVFKPMMCGTKREDIHSDAYFLKSISEDPHTLTEINPFQFDEWITPYLAAKHMGLTITLDDVIKKWNQLQQRDFYIVEGAGGLMVPLGPDYLVAHVAKRMKLPIIIVARPNLGTINHTLLTIETARNVGLTVAGVILNGLKDKGVVEKTNPKMIEKFSGVPVLGTVPWIEQVNEQTLMQTFEQSINMDLFLSLLK